MIPNQWYIILESRQVRQGKLVGVTRLGEKLVLWRDSQGKLSCLADHCPHRGAAFSVGKLVGDCIQCPFHGFEFDSNGRCNLIPANGRVSEPPKAMHGKVYPVAEANDFIYLWYGDHQPNLPPLPWLDLDHSQFSYRTAIDPWDTHYSRAIENQLDVVHLPFVHYNTIGRGNLTVVNGPYSEWSEDEKDHPILNIWLHNEVDRGQNPKRSSEMRKPNRPPFLQFRFPNIWQLRLADNLRQFLAFVPVDDTHTLVYLRQYQRTILVPGLREIFNALSMLGNIFILHQDRSVVHTQRPIRTSLRMGEMLIPADNPIIEYRRQREEMISATKGTEPNGKNHGLP